MLSLVCAASPGLAGCVVDGGGADAGGSTGDPNADSSTTNDPPPGDTDPGDTDATTDGPDDTTGEPDDAQTFRITVTNAGRYHATEVFNTPEGAKEPGPLVEVGQAYSVQFSAAPGSRLNFATMSAATNDWFFAPEGAGIELFDSDGTPMTGDITDAIDLWDAGTEEEDPATVATAPGGAEAGDPDDDDTVRVVMADVSASLTADLAYEEGVFTLTLTREGEDILTPGMVVVHTADDALFTEGQPDRGAGLELLAETGSPMDLYDWFNEPGTDGAPLRLSSSITPFSPGVVYAFPGEGSDPLFTQGEAAIAGSGVEELAEAGNNQVAFDYLTGEGYEAALSENDGGVGPGGALTFTLDAVPGDRLGFATMLVQSNDWFFAFNNDGVALFDDDGNPAPGDSSIEAYLFDAGTEADEPVGLGENQAPRQADPDAGDPDEDPLIRRVGAIDDVQFGKGLIESGPAVVGLEDPRGGYNLVTVTVELVE
ncbi:MAG: spondin domain-containing protein [Deltaproteobacteria bacterium]|nr:spondin domain-containing protein [Deltaproteobacteria bacterium]